MIVSIKIEAADFFGGKALQQMFRLARTFDPGLLPRLQVQWCGHVQFPELLRPEMCRLLALLKDHKRIDTRILASRRPAKSAQSQMVLVKENDVQIIARFAATHEREHFVGGSVINVEPPPFPIPTF